MSSAFLHPEAWTPLVSGSKASGHMQTSTLMPNLQCPRVVWVPLEVKAGGGQGVHGSAEKGGRV